MRALRGCGVGLMPERLADPEALFRLAVARANDVRPLVVGIAGPPGSGKSTLAEEMCRRLTDLGLKTRYCPMDGFHLSNARLENAGLRHVKGRIDTFDAEGFLDAVKALETGKAFRWPIYSRKLHGPVADGTRIGGDEDVHVVEGNYLFVDAPVWNRLSDRFGLRVFVEVDDATLARRLHSRHRASGKTTAEARRWVAEVDLPNARVVRATLPKAEFMLDGTMPLPHSIGNGNDAERG